MLARRDADDALSGCAHRPPTAVHGQRGGRGRGRGGGRGRGIESRRGSRWRDGGSVEEVALAHYKSEGWTLGVHSENSIWLHLFGEIMADALFDETSHSTSHSSIRDAPFDLCDCRRFAPNRRARIERVLGRLREPGGGSRALMRAAERRSTRRPCIGVMPGRYSADFLRAVVEAMGDEGLAAVCGAMVDDYAAFEHGAPDLMLLQRGAGVSSDAEGGVGSDTGGVTDTGASEGRLSDEGGTVDASTVDASATDASCRWRLMLVEVKGPGDRLSDKQLAWIDLLSRNRIAVEVCYVESEE